MPGHQATAATGFDIATTILQQPGTEGTLLTCRHTPRHTRPLPPATTPPALQLLSAVCYLHDHWVMHRDLKLSNLLFTHAGALKLCDYGLARYFQPWQESYTPGVVTLWYR